MAAKAKKTFDDAKTYRVEVNRVIAITPTTSISPRHHDIRLRGSVLNSVPAAAIVLAEEV